MNTYSIGADSARWWWPSTAAGAAGVAAIAAILVLPAGGSTVPDKTSPNGPPVMTRESRVTIPDPGFGRQCFGLPTRWDAVVERGRLTCGRTRTMQRPKEQGVRRNLDARP